MLGIEDIIFPPRCIACGGFLGETDGIFCFDCFSKIDFIRSPLCTCCGQPFAETGNDNHLCGDCLILYPSYSSARSLGKYETALLELIHRFKYGGKFALGEHLGVMMAQFDYPDFNIDDYSLIIPVPLHPRRLRQRGFNQALILAREIARAYAMKLDFLSLKRIVYTDSQTRLNKEMRKRNIKGAFSVANAEKIEGESIILVDDVYTTGETVKECASTLLKKGAEKVAVLTLARA